MPRSPSSGTAFSVAGLTHAILGAALIALIASGQAHAHEDGLAGGFISGFTHPILGWDHVVAMVAVGLWGAFLGRPAIWLLPVIFPLVMAFGGVLGIIGVPVPFVEPGIAISSIALGLLIALALRLPLAAAAIIVGAFAIFHGYAHGVELPAATSPLPYALGFVVATGCLHLAGILLGLLVHAPGGRIVIRAGGAAISVIGCLFLFGIA